MDFAPIAGSPVLPPEWVTLFVIVILAVLVFSYLIIHRLFRPTQLHHRLQLLLITAIGLKIGVVVGIGVVILYWLVPTPQIVATNPSVGYTTTSTQNKITIRFSRPVARQPINKTITPEAPGRWVFEEPVYGTHLYYSLAFYPTYSLSPDTEYTITVDNIKNLAQLSQPITYEFSFATQSLPQVEQVTPSASSSGIEIDDPLVVRLDGANTRDSLLEFELSPEIELEVVPDGTNQTFVLLPTKPLNQGTQYQLKILQTHQIWDISNNQIAQRGQTETIHQSTFTTVPAPGIESITPSGDAVSIDSPIEVRFTQPMNRASVEQHFQISPDVPGTIVWEDEQTFRFNPTQLDYDIIYELMIKAGTKTAADGFLESDITHSFKTIGPVQVTQIYPHDQWSNVGVHTPITIEFDQPIDQLSAEEHIFIGPDIEGTFSWEENTVTFTPTNGFAYSSDYVVTVDTGIKSLQGLDSQEPFVARFSTQNQTTKLLIAPHLQEYSLSCEVAALKMALAYKGVDVSEDELMTHVGYDDPNPKQGNIWGDPHLGFVGLLNGRQMYTGYGVYWDPIAKAANQYRQAEAFSGWTTAQLAEQISQNNPVVIWSYSKGGVPTTWYTPAGKEIFAISGEHTFTVTGFVGPASNPVQIILNDPLVGEIYLNRAIFEQRWAVLGNAGVVVY